MSLKQPSNKLRKENSMRNFDYDFRIRTFQAERGKYKIELVR